MLTKYFSVVALLLLVVAALSYIPPSTAPTDNNNLSKLLTHLIFFAFLFCYIHMWLLPIVGIVFLVKRKFLYGLFYIIAPVIFYFSIIGSNWDQF
jgi:cytochrome b561